ncbi:hypothetical protein ASF19_20135 [Acidovorax sp. Leaf84]|uniref:hypothetical protein n=1 Tax=Acidovorax sp. Leaf84 TaxID=1736240 RepID=UPI0006F324C8|nr:hypothetical protein [Acidovorax sp. Leaf84]KQO38086.1 hypothetical protein ASF19_20135 [Acidovorax sp. Leaf84]
MSFPSINGAAINSEEGGDVAVRPAGLDLVAHGQHTVSGFTTAGGSVPLELGQPSLVTAIEPVGLDLVTAGAHVGEHQIDVHPAGLDLVTHGVSAVVFTPVAGDGLPLELGTPRLRSGLDIAVEVPGIDLVRRGLHSAMVGGIIEPDMITVTGGARPLEVGRPSMLPAAESRTAGGARPLELGTPSVGAAFQAGGGQPLQLGVPSIGHAALAGGARPLQFGVPRLNTAIAPQGLDLVRAGVHFAEGGAWLAVAGGGMPLEVGEPGPLGHMATTRQAFPLQLGVPSISRGIAC